MSAYIVIVGEDNIAREFDHSITIERAFARRERLVDRREPYDPAWSIAASLPATRTDERKRPESGTLSARVERTHDWHTIRGTGRCVECGISHPATWHDKIGGAQ